MKNELQSWLEENKTILAKYDTYEKGQMAVACGFSLDEVAATLPEYHMDSLTRTTYRQREQYFVDRELNCAEHVLGKPDLSENWLRLWEHENGLGE